MIELLQVPDAAVTGVAAAFVPLALAVVDEPDRHGRSAPTILWARRLVPLGSAGVIASAFVARGALAVALLAPYVVVAALAALHGVGRVLARGLRPASELAIGAGLAFFAGAAVWLIAHRAGFALMGYPPYWVALTSAHFHVAGLILPVVAGLHARSGGPVLAVAAWGTVIGVPATAIGIAWSRSIEVAAALVVATSALAIAARAVRAGGLHVVAGLALLGSMPLAAAYALRLDVRLGSLTALDTMAVTHGVANVVFALCSLAAFALARPAPAWRRGIPYSRLAARGHVGATFFARTGVETSPPDPPSGLVDRMDQLAHPGFDVAVVAPAIRAFYERTMDHDMVVRPRWRLGFRTGARLWSWIARGLGQLRLPLVAERGDEPVHSRIVPLDATRDGRPGVRGWVRSFVDGRAMYVAAYAVHRCGDDAFMNIAFPVPLGHMTSILRCEPLPGGGVNVSTVRAGRATDAGIYAVLAGVVIRLPLNEDIRVWVEGANVVARHDVWLLGLRIVTLDYVISARATDAAT